VHFGSSGFIFHRGPPKATGSIMTMDYPRCHMVLFTDIAWSYSSRHYTVSMLFAQCHKKQGDGTYVTASWTQRCLFLSRALFYPSKCFLAYQVYQKAAQRSFIPASLLG